MKRNAKNVSPWKPGALSVLITVLFVAFACTEEPAGNVEGITSEGEGELFTVVESLPEYEKGMPAFYSYVGQDIRYPKTARVQGVEGKVWAQFTVERDGTLSDIEVVKGIGAGCDEEAVRVLKTVEPFKPGNQRGRAVRVRMVFPITFKLKEEEKNPDGTAQGMIILDELQVRNSQLSVEWDYSDGAWVGTVYDEEKERLPGANIVVSGTTNGTVSDLDGTFRLPAAPSQEVVVSFVGYESLKLTKL